MGRRGYADLRRSSSVDGSRPALPSDILSNGFGDQGHRDTGDDEKKDVHLRGSFQLSPFPATWRSLKSETPRLLSLPTLQTSLHVN